MSLCPTCHHETEQLTMDECPKCRRYRLNCKRLGRKWKPWEERYRGRPQKTGTCHECGRSGRITKKGLCPTCHRRQWAYGKYGTPIMKKSERAKILAQSRQERKQKSYLAALRTMLEWHATMIQTYDPDAPPFDVPAAIARAKAAL